MKDSLKRLIRTLPPKEAKEFSDAVSLPILQLLAVSILEAVPKEKFKELEKHIAAGDTKELGAFLKHNAPTLDARMDESLARMREEAHMLLS